MNEKLEKAKKKLKRNAPLIAAMTGLIAVATIIYIRSKSNQTSNEPTHTYSYGTDSVWKIEATESEITAFNRHLKAFYEAQKKILDETGESWNGGPLWMNVKRGDNKIYNRLARRLTAALALINQDETPIEITEDYLIKN